MFGSSLNRATAYRDVGVETGVAGADPHQLIQMLLDGALVAIRAAALAMDAGDIPTKGRNISRAIEIISSGLMASLDMEAGGDLAAKLSALYQYMLDRLLQANLRNDRAALDESAALLGEIKTAWEGIATQVSHTA